MVKVNEQAVSNSNGVVDGAVGRTYEDLFESVYSDDAVRTMVLELVGALEGRIEVRKVVLVGRYADGRAAGVDDVEGVIVSPDFEGMDEAARMRLVSEIAVLGDVHPAVMDCGRFTPAEYADGGRAATLEGDGHEGRVVYEKGGD